MDNSNWLPCDVRRLITEFRGVKPTSPHVQEILLEDPGETYVQDRGWDMIWMRDGPQSSRWTYRWVGGALAFSSGRPVWPKRSPEWAERAAYR